MYLHVSEHVVANGEDALALLAVDARQELGVVLLSKEGIILIQDLCMSN